MSIIFQGNRSSNQTVSTGTTNIDFDNIDINESSRWASGVFTADESMSLLCVLNTRYNASSEHAAYVDSGSGFVQIDQGNYQGSTDKTNNSVFSIDLDLGDELVFRLNRASPETETLDGSEDYFNTLVMFRTG